MVSYCSWDHAGHGKNQGAPSLGLLPFEKIKRCTKSRWTSESLIAQLGPGQRWWRQRSARTCDKSGTLNWIMSIYDSFVSVMFDCQFAKLEAAMELHPCNPTNNSSANIKHIETRAARHSAIQNLENQINLKMPVASQSLHQTSGLSANTESAIAMLSSDSQHHTLPIISQSREHASNASLILSLPIGPKPLGNILLYLAKGVFLKDENIRISMQTNLKMRDLRSTNGTCCYHLFTQFLEASAVEACCR